MEKLADLPLPALVTLGFVLALIIGIRYLGLWQGERNSPQKSQAQASVAAVIVDPTALNKAAESALDVAAELRDLKSAVNSLTLEIARKR